MGHNQRSVVGDIAPKGADYLSFATEAFEDRVGLMLAVLDTGSRLMRVAA